MAMPIEKPANKFYWPSDTLAYEGHGVEYLYYDNDLPMVFGRYVAGQGYEYFIGDNYK